MVVLDKTGTLTEGEAALAAIHATGMLPAEEVLRLAASLDQASFHVVAAAIVDAARERAITTVVAQEVVESAGTGIEGVVEGRRVIVGGRRLFVQGRSPPTRPVNPRRNPGPPSPGVALVAVAVDGQFGRCAGVLADRVRPEAAATLRALRRLGVQRGYLPLASLGRSLRIGGPRSRR